MWSTPIFADIDENGLLEMLIGGDITTNASALTKTGGIFHVFRRDGRDVVPGFSDFIEFLPDTPSFIKGKYEEQVIWSSPEVADIDGDGHLEVGYGTGLFADEPVGDHITIWNHDGTLFGRLDTVGRVFSVPLFADLDNDGDYEIVATTARGYVHIWDHQGNELHRVQTFPTAGIGQENTIFASPLAVDFDGDNDLELVFQQGSSVVIVSHTGVQLTDANKYGLHNEDFRSTPAVYDVDLDGRWEIITGGANQAQNQGVVYCFQYGTAGAATNGRHARRFFMETSQIPVNSTQSARRTRGYEFC